MSAQAVPGQRTAAPTATSMDLGECAMCECRFEGCDGFICHGLDAD
jgi:hypothetical protein